MFADTLNFNMLNGLDIGQTYILWICTTDQNDFIFGKKLDRVKLHHGRAVQLC